MSVHMVDVSGKPDSQREAVATGFIKLKKSTIELIRSGKIEKGNVLDVSSVSAILGVKKTIELLPLTHNIPISNVKVDFNIEEEGIRVYVTVKTTAKTGVEMEALMGATAALLNIWDMVKKYEKDEKGQYPETVITDVRVLSKVKTPLG
ncbi:cyclic pyranopterin monophosphate synthase MoaC [Thermosphaera aggregans]|jgi:cyclic pyranopterin phosphate synthase|uniref:Probable cyclic pyranopterin monophosphate synthase n=1 Tax=Thermosphaera aggregans (strain DSM 11486 / M11TL) TaxID=633148 RepID=D5U187_THEAM|nr:cyclic pyranopterin monophosphate synthase MoaC [Thermosphaera aggregans]ADG90887.1 GTP cyclohydrolase subunit MoaC [Thermosphaera aggregans DSM 11486]